MITFGRKPYKAALPEQTIQRIKAILLRLDFATEVSCGSHVPGLHFAKVTLKDTRVATNGKGPTKEYAEASGLAEFMERLQNDFLFNNHIINPYFVESLGGSLRFDMPFLYAPDEEWRYWHDSSQGNHSTLGLIDQLENKSSNGSQRYVFLPFWDAYKKRIVEIPIQLLRSMTGSTGMCSGNTDIEAVSHGICEIFERYVLRRLFESPVRIPTIPMEYFKGSSVENLINHFVQKGFNVEVKDCSLGVGLPVVGLVIANKETGMYHFHLGSDPDPAIALQRCFTETFLETTAAAIDRKFHPIDLDSKSGVQPDAYEKNFLYGSGVAPTELLSCLDVVDPSDRYSGGASEAEDLDYLMKIISNLGYSLLVRNVSFLGFPSFYVFIPGMSEKLGSSVESYFASESSWNAFTRLSLSLNRCSCAELTQLSELIDSQNLQKKRLFGTSSLESILPIPIENEVLKNVDLELFQFMIAFRAGQVKKGHAHLDEFLKQTNPPRSTHSYYYCIKDFTALLGKYSRQDSLEILTKYYTTSIVNRVADISKSNILSKIPMPDCFYCDSCRLQTDCQYIKYSSLFLNAQAKKTEWHWNQELPLV